VSGNISMFGPGLDGSTFQQLQMWATTANGMLFEAPLNSSNTKLTYHFNWRGGGTDGMTLTPSGLTVNGTFVSSSDRNMKDNFAAVSAQSVLEKVIALPITEWSFKQDSDKRHIGPMAQDFHAVFGLNGGDDKHIATLDENGVALAAIQGLNQKVEAKDTEIQDLKARLEKLEQLMNAKNGAAK
jgi:hypothetical protein